MPEYPDNSHSARENSTSPPEKKLEKVVTGGAKTRKRARSRSLLSFSSPRTQRV